MDETVNVEKSFSEGARPEVGKKASVLAHGKYPQAQYLPTCLLARSAFTTFQA